MGDENQCNGLIRAGKPLDKNSDPLCLVLRLGNMAGWGVESAPEALQLFLLLASLQICSLLIITLSPFNMLLVLQHFHCIEHPALIFQEHGTNSKEDIGKTAGRYGC